MVFVVRFWRYLLIALLPLLPVGGFAADQLVVTVAPLSTLLVYPQQSAPAMVISDNDSRLSAEVSGVIERIPVEVGEVVDAGTPLVELQKTDIQLEVREAEATLSSLVAKSRLAKEQFRRVRSLASKRSVTEELVGQRKTEVAVSDADVVRQRIRIEQLRRSLEKTVVRAPFKGIVVEKLASIGELAQPGTPLLRVVDGESIEVSAAVQSSDVDSLMGAAQARFFTRQGEFEVVVRRVIPVIDERERSQEVRLRFSGVGALIGSSGHLRWRNVAARIPADLLVRRAEGMGVFVVDDDELARFELLPGAEEGRPALNSLPLDAVVVLDGRFVVRDGQALQVLSDGDR